MHFSFCISSALHAEKVESQMPWRFKVTSLFQNILFSTASFRSQLNMPTDVEKN